MSSWSSSFLFGNLIYIFIVVDPSPSIPIDSLLRLHSYWNLLSPSITSSTSTACDLLPSHSSLWMIRFNTWVSCLASWPLHKFSHKSTYKSNVEAKICICLSLWGWDNSFPTVFYDSNIFIIPFSWTLYHFIFLYWQIIFIYMYIVHFLANLCRFCLLDLGTEDL